MSSSNAVCDLAKSFADNSLLRAVLLLSLTVCSTTLILLAAIVIRRKSYTIAIHNNLKILLLNAMILYLAATAAVVVEYSRRLVLFGTYADPCGLLVPPLEIVLVRGVGYTYSISFPLWHLAVSAERAWATIRPSEYEKSGCVYAVIASGFVWSYSLSHVTFLVYLSYQDETFRSGSPFLSLTTKSSANAVLLSTYEILALDVVCVFLDIVLAFINKRNMRRVACDYSLGHTYQVNENVLVTMRLILPLDICNAGLYIVTMSFGIVLRQQRLLFEPDKFQALLELSTLVTWLQPPVSLLIFMRFCKGAKRQAVIVEQHAQSDLFFEQFRRQIGTADAMERRTSL